MRVPLSWLRDFVSVEVAPESLAETLTMAGLEVSKIDLVGRDWDRELILVGEIVEVRPHPEADRLTVARVAYGSGRVAETVSGAPNVRVGDRGQKVVLALPGASFLDPESGGQRRIILKPAEIRGVRSEGMLCSERELGISEDHSGVMILDPEVPVGTPLQDYLGDTVLDLDLTPNLGRCFSIIGVAREVAALTGQALKRLPPDALALSSEGGWRCLTDENPRKATTSYVSVEILEPELCSRYSACLIEGVRIGPSPMWMQNRLRLAGMRPINNVVDVTNYCMWELGQPLHAFDYEKIRGKRVLVRRAQPGEEIVTLDGVLRGLTDQNLLIADEGGPIAIAGVMGGLDSEVGEGTRSILLEAANFELTSIRRTVQALKLPSEASLRFGKGIDPELTVPTLQRASLLVKGFSGAAVSPEIADAYPVRVEERVIHLSTGEIRRILGMDFPVERVSAILESLEFQCVKTEEPGTLAVTVPTHRLDVSIAVDLIEEVARIHGYDKIPATLMQDVLPPQRSSPYLDFEEQIRDVLAGCGLMEVITYTMTNGESVSKLDPGKREPDLSEFIRLVNPVSLDKTVMRRSLLAGMLETVCFNSRFSNQLMFFEIGRVYRPLPDQELPEEEHRLGIVVSGPADKGWWGGPESGMVGFFHLKGILDVLFGRLGVVPCEYVPATYGPFHPGKSAVVRAGGEDAGYLGELHPDVQRNFELPDQPVAAAELNLDLLFGRRRERRYRPISPFPAAREDLAVVLKEEIPFHEIVSVVMEAGSPLVKEVELFDVWRGAKIPEGEKSIAFSLVYQADDHVLRAEEIKETRESIIDRLSDALGARLRE
ncbi:MAG: phenylalanine--tRNA ligase subunit beta [Deltaproteobacteria bacterium]|nr:phenylalanine--tRNA ligase subunit beta [Deltaproteobacteria bacterium]